MKNFVIVTPVHPEVPSRNWSIHTPKDMGKCGNLDPPTCAEIVNLYNFGMEYRKQPNVNNHDKFTGVVTGEVRGQVSRSLGPTDLRPDLTCVFSGTP